MAILSFPVAPVNGQLFPTSPLVGQSQYQWDSTAQTWVLQGAATGVIPGCYGDAYSVPSFCVDATGRISFAGNVPIAANSPDLQQVTAEGAVTTDTVTVGGLIAAGLTYPVVDGGSGEVLTTDGAGNLGWGTPASGTVTDVTAGLGLLGGTITTSGTIDLDTAYTDTLYLSLAGGTMAGDITFTGTQTFPGVLDLAGGTMTGDITFSGTQTFPAQDLQTVTTAGATTTNTIDVAGLVAAGLSYPLVDGAAGEVLTTDGAGGLGWVTTAEIVATPGSSAAGGADNQISFDAAGNFYFFKGGQWWQVAGSSF